MNHKGMQWDPTCPRFHVNNKESAYTVGAASNRGGAGDRETVAIKDRQNKGMTVVTQGEEEGKQYQRACYTYGSSVPK